MLIVHRSNRAEELARALSEVASRPLASPLTPEVVVVSSQGMSRWLAQDLATRLGVWANARFPFPRAFIDEVLAARPASGADPTAWGRESLTWSIAALLPETARRKGAESIAAYLNGDEHGLKRFALATQLAHAFDQYAAYRPELVRAWERGAGRGFQPDLFRALSSRLGQGHIAARTEAFLGGPLPDGLPERVSLFGVAGLPRAYVRILSRLGQEREVHVFVLASSPADRDNQHPLAAALGQMGREFERLLEEEAPGALRRDAFVEPKRRTMLDVVQSDLFGGKRRAPGSREAPRVTPKDGDTSIAVHSCHSRGREVEVLRDQLLALFEADATLDPHDVIVMAPNIDEYAPLVESVFGPGSDAGKAIPHRIADLSAVKWNAAAEALLRVLQLVSSRMKASDVLDLLQLPPVLARFDIAPESLPELRRMVLEAGIRWGVNAEHRLGLGLVPRRENTWEFGLERLLLGHALPEEATLDPYHGVLPIDATTSDRSDLVGKLSEAARTVFALRAALDAPRPVAEWSRALHEALDALVASEEPHGLGARLVRDALDVLVRQAEAARYDGPVHRDALATLLQSALDAERSSQSFLTGGVTFCALLPMRAIPFRVVCILGLNDADFPRKDRAAAFDLMAHSPEVGDRSSRKEDRQLFLEAVLSARERLVLSYVGRDAHDNSIFPPSVVLAELEDLLDSTFSATPERPGQLPLLQASADGFGERVVVQHPLQPWSAKYFDGADPRLFSYAGEQAAGARARARAARGAARERFHGAALGHEPATVVSLNELVRFLENPARGLLQRRLGVRLDDEVHVVSDRQPIELSPLEHYDVGQRLLTRALSGGDDATVLEFARALGVLPAGTPGDVDLTAVLSELQLVRARAEEWLQGGRLAPLPVEVATEEGTLTGVLRDVYPQAQAFVRFSRLKPKHELGAWVRHLALCAMGAMSVMVPARTVVIGRGEGNGDGVTVCAFSPVAPKDARAYLSRLIALYHLGQRAPLSLFPTASATYARTLAKTDPPDHLEALDEARKVFRGSKRSSGDAEDAYVSRIFEGEDPFTDRVVPFDETGELGLPGFAEIARAVFGPLLEHREKSP